MTPMTLVLKCQIVPLVIFVPYCLLAFIIWDLVPPQMLHNGGDYALFRCFWGVRYGVTSEILLLEHAVK